eukprot:COSAG06_NODE_2504_length_6751_cov_103.337041_7_plen_70_part_00
MGNVMDHARSVFKKYDKDGNGTPADWLAAVLPAVLAGCLAACLAACPAGLERLPTWNCHSRVCCICVIN